MKFGQIAHPETVNFTLPPDAPETKPLLGHHKGGKPLEICVGCAKWNRADLKGFYPRGTKDELTYYSRQFNSIEMNATFYKMPEIPQVQTWKEKTPDGFKFFPKIPNIITHYRRLINVQEPIEQFCDAVSHFEEKLGMAFMQLHENFGPKDFDRLKGVLEAFPKAVPLAVEVRHPQWFADPGVWAAYSGLLEKLQMSNIIVDTAGRRDMLHMRLTGSEAFVRYVGANHASDIERLDHWVERVAQWRTEGLKKLYFFVHQNVEVESPLLAGHFIEKLNKELGVSLHTPEKPNTGQQGLFS